MTVTVYVPKDASALSLGADEVADAIVSEAAVRKVDLHLVRNGSRGNFSLEPLVEVVTPKGRVGYGPVTPADVPALFAADFINGGQHPLALGVVDELPWFKSQQRLTFARVGIIDPTSVADYVANDGYQGLRRALAMTPQEIVQAVLDSGLRGRGGAAFPTGKIGRAHV